MAEVSPGVICASLEGLLDLDPGLGLPSVSVTACRGNIGLTKKSDFHRIFLANQYIIWETLLYSGLPWWLRRKESTCNVGNLGSISGLGRSPEKGIATLSSILAWRIPRTEEPGRLQSIQSQELDLTERISLTHSLYPLTVLILLAK